MNVITEIGYYMIPGIKLLVIDVVGDRITYPSMHQKVKDKVSS